MFTFGIIKAGFITFTELFSFFRFAVRTQTKWSANDPSNGSININ